LAGATFRRISGNLPRHQDADDGDYRIIDRSHLSVLDAEHHPHDKHSDDPRQQGQAGRREIAIVLFQEL
jgi:hypothetical protein